LAENRYHFSGIMLGFGRVLNTVVSEAETALGTDKADQGGTIIQTNQWEGRP